MSWSWQTKAISHHPSCIIKMAHYDSTCCREPRPLLTGIPSLVQPPRHCCPSVSFGCIVLQAFVTHVVRTYACHLLALITRRRHVRPYRIQALWVDKRHISQLSVDRLPASYCLDRPAMTLPSQACWEFTKTTIPRSLLETQPEERRLLSKCVYEIRLHFSY